MKEKKLTEQIDFTLLVSMLLLIGFGLLAIYSASNGAGSMRNFNKQLMWSGISIAVFVLIYFLPYRVLQDWSYIAYGISIVGLVLVLILARRIAGSESWLEIGGASFQPSEVTKFTTILALANFLSRKNTDIKSFKDFSIAVAIVLLPVALILRQPDAGTALMYLTFIVPMIVVGGFDFFYIVLLAIPIVFALVGFLNLSALIFVGIAAMIVIALFRRSLILSTLSLGAGAGLGIMSSVYAARILKPHQQKRLATFLDPMSDPQGAGYNALQAKVAIGSGGLTGKGFLQGTQTQLKFIPAQWTDFIFCVIGEEFGFIGCAVLLITFLVLLLRLTVLADIIKNKFTALVLAGIISVFTGHLIINVGMTIGLTPVVGVPLPFLSYGGSSLLANVIAVALAMNFYRNRRNLSF
ncbi:MAG: rod shape-determining protein RodA [Rhizobacter sp.]|nr:rod shape-determining protein RodA [Chlorobiales bacterium]